MTDEGDPTSGQLYSRLYLDKPKSIEDSLRARKRVSAAYFNLPNSARDGFASSVKAELGVDVPLHGYNYNFTTFFETCVRRDFLDSITLLAHRLTSTERAKWITLIQRIFSEEGLPFRIDTLGGIHPTVDLELDRSRQSIIQGLDEAGLSAARVSIEAAFNALGVDGSDTVSMVRNSFDALENHMKSRFEVARLGSKEIEKHIRPLALQRYEGRAKEAASQLISSYAKLVDAAHQYRHADGEAEPTPPPMELAIAFVSLSASFLRLLLDLTSGK